MVISSVLPKVLPRLLLLILLSLMSLSVWAAVSEPIKIKFSRTHFQMGESTTLYLQGEHVEEKVPPALVEQLRRYLMVFHVEGNGDSVRFILYAQKPGNFMFPAFNQGDFHLKAQHFEITSNPEVKLAWQRDAKKLFQHQTLNWSVTAQLADPTYRAKLHLVEEQEAVNRGERPLVDKSAYRALSSGLAIAERKTQGGRIERLFTAAYTFKQVGQVKAVVPYLEVHNRSQRPWRFFAYPNRHFMFHVKPLPSYLPPNLPVGKLLLSETPTHGWIESGDLVQWTLKLVGQGVAVDFLPSLDNQLQGDQATRWLANSLQKEETFTPAGYQSQLSLHQPIQFMHFGWHALPEIRLLSFNPHTEKVEITQLPSQTLWVWPAGLGILAKLLVFLLGIGLLAFSLWGFKLSQQRRRHLQAIRLAHSPQTLWCRLQAYLKWLATAQTAEHIDACETHQLGHPVATFWQKVQQLRNQKWGKQESQLAEQLNQVLFAPTAVHPDFEALKQVVFTWSRQQTVWQKMKQYFLANYSAHP